MKKNNFRINNKVIENAHTYYYVLKRSGLQRLLINFYYISVVISYVLISYLV